MQYDSVEGIGFGHSSPERPQPLSSVDEAVTLLRTDPTESNFRRVVGTAEVAAQWGGPSAAEAYLQTIRDHLNYLRNPEERAWIESLTESATFQLLVTGEIKLPNPPGPTEGR